MVIFLTLIMLLTGCSPRVIENTVIRTDTCYVEKVRRDSIYQHDSIYIRETVKGDTVRIETLCWRDRWRDRLIRDTAYVSRTDTVKVSEVREVPRQLTSWQNFQIVIGRLAMLALLVAAAVWYLKKKVPDLFRKNPET